MKKILSAIISCIMTVSIAVIPFGILASAKSPERYEMTDESGNITAQFRYNIVGDSAEIVGIKVFDNELIIPSEIDGYQVEVNCPTVSQEDKDSITSIKFEDGIQNVHWFCVGCHNLKDIYLPPTLNGEGLSFPDCSNLERITIPGSFKELNGCFMMRCTKLKDVTIEDGVEVIGEEAFGDCAALTSITLPDSVKVIGKYAFAGCTELTNINIPDIVWNIENNAFNACSSLKKIDLPKNLKYLGDYAFYESGIEEIKLPSGLESIGEYAFAETPLKQINLPSSLDSLGDRAFASCYNLVKTNIPKNILHKPNRAWQGCTALKDITIDGEMTKELYEHLAKETPWGEEFDKDIKEDWVIFEGNYLAKYKGTDKNPVIPDNVTEIGEYSFRYADIDSVTFSEKIKEIPYRAFSYSKIKELTVPPTIKKIGKMAFLNCTELEKITVEDGVEYIDSEAFMNCYGITKENVILGNSVRKAPDAFKQTRLDKDFTDSGNLVDKTDKATETPMPTAAPEQKTLTVQGGEEIKISVDGEAAEFDAKPFIDDNGRTQVPVRAVSELVNCKVDWNQESQTAVIEKDNGDTVKITLGSDIMLMNDNQIKMDTAAQIKDDRTYIPVRFVAEALGLTVNWIE